MAESETRQLGNFYFALPRLICRARGGSAARAERNWVEAYIAGLAMYFIAYAAIVTALNARAIVTLVLLVFATWLCWLVVLYANALLVVGARRIGLFGGLSNARAQNILIGAEISLCALVLLRRNDWLRAIGCVWLTLVALNIAAFVILALLPRRDCSR